MKIIFFLPLLLTLISPLINAQIPLPIGVGGIVEIDNIPVGGITVQVENLNTGEVKTTTTAYDTPYTKCGYYTVALTGQNGDTIKITVTYGYTYSNTVIVDISQITQWCNLSIFTEEPYEPPDNPPGGNGDNIPDEPDEPENNETEEPPENNTDNDIPNLCNLTVTVFDNTTNTPVNNASVTIYDNNETKITKSYTNETGEAKFLLEESIYIIEVEKNNQPSSYHTVSLLASTKYTVYMPSQNKNSSSPCRTCQQKDVFPAIYIIIAIIIVVVSVIIFFYRRYHT